MLGYAWLCDSHNSFINKRSLNSRDENIADLFPFILINWTLIIVLFVNNCRVICGEIAPGTNIFGNYKPLFQPNHFYLILYFRSYIEFFRLRYRHREFIFIRFVQRRNVLANVYHRGVPILFSINL